MIDDLPALEKLLRQFQRVPYLASKNLYRVVEFFLNMDKAALNNFSSSLLDAKNRLKKCRKCFSWCETNDLCGFCTSKKRNHSIICVVQSWHDLFIIEKTGGYSGQYHILGGVISPLDGIGPEDLTIQHLVKRVVERAVEPASSGEYKEIILALSQTPEGEVTSCLIAKKLEKTKILITSLATGVPVGSSLEYTDRLTLSKAISERREF